MSELQAKLKKRLEKIDAAEVSTEDTETGGGKKSAEVLIEPTLKETGDIHPYASTNEEDASFIRAKPVIPPKPIVVNKDINEMTDREFELCKLREQLEQKNLSDLRDMQIKLEEHKFMVKKYEAEQELKRLGLGLKQPQGEIENPSSELVRQDQGTVISESTREGADLKRMEMLLHYQLELHKHATELDLRKQILEGEMKQKALEFQHSVNKDEVEASWKEKHLELLALQQTREANLREMEACHRSKIQEEEKQREMMLACSKIKVDELDAETRSKELQLKLMEHNDSMRKFEYGLDMEKKRHDDQVKYQMMVLAQEADRNTAETQLKQRQMQLQELQEMNMMKKHDQELSLKTRAHDDDVKFQLLSKQHEMEIADKDMDLRKQQHQLQALQHDDAMRQYQKEHMLQTQKHDDEVRYNLMAFQHQVKQDEGDNTARDKEMQFRVMQHNDDVVFRQQDQQRLVRKDEKEDEREQQRLQLQVVECGDKMRLQLKLLDVETEQRKEEMKMRMQQHDDDMILQQQKFKFYEKQDQAAIELKHKALDQEVQQMKMESELHLIKMQDSRKGDNEMLKQKLKEHDQLMKMHEMDLQSQLSYKTMEAQLALQGMNDRRLGFKENLIHEEGRDKRGLGLQKELHQAEMALKYEQMKMVKDQYKDTHALEVQKHRDEVHHQQALLFADAQRQDKDLAFRKQVQDGQRQERSDQLDANMAQHKDRLDHSKHLHKEDLGFQKQKHEDNHDLRKKQLGLQEKRHVDDVKLRERGQEIRMEELAVGKDIKMQQMANEKEMKVKELEFKQDKHRDDHALATKKFAHQKAVDGVNAAANLAKIVKPF